MRSRLRQLQITTFRSLSSVTTMPFRVWRAFSSRFQPHFRVKKPDQADAPSFVCRLVGQGGRIVSFSWFTLAFLESLLRFLAKPQRGLRGRLVGTDLVHDTKHGLENSRFPVVCSTMQSLPLKSLLPPGKPANLTAQVRPPRFRRDDIARDGEIHLRTTRLTPPTNPPRYPQTRPQVAVKQPVPSNTAGSISPLTTGAGLAVAGVLAGVMVRAPTKKSWLVYSFSLHISIVCPPRCGPVLVPSFPDIPNSISPTPHPNRRARSRPTPWLPGPPWLPSSASPPAACFPAPRTRTVSPRSTKKRWRSTA